MPLLIDNQLINFPININEIFKHHTNLIARSHPDINHIKVFDDDNSILYVYQREYCLIYPQESAIKILGSDEATTCHILLIRHTINFSIMMAHIDNDQNLDSWLNKVLMELVMDDTFNENKSSQLPNSTLFDVWIYGGYLDEQGFSEKITTALLAAMSNLKAFSFNLIMLCTGYLNTKYITKEKLTQSQLIPIPIVTGVAYNVHKNSLLQTPPNPAIFLQKGPDALLRSARNLINADTNYINISPQGINHDIIQFDFLIPKVKMGSLISMLPDEVLLNNFSTSPYAESESFLPKIREMFKVLNLSHDGESVIKENNTYKMNHETGKWEKIK